MTAASTQTRPVTPRDLTRIRILEDQALSPDGTQVAFTVSTIDPETLFFESAIWLTAIDGSEPVRLTRGELGDNTPLWRPDGGALAFVSDRGNGKQVYLLDFSGAEPRVVTSFASGVAGFAWAPDGKSLAVIAPDEAPADVNPDSRRITRLHYKGDGVGLLPETHNHLYLVALDNGAVTQMTDGDEDEGAPAFSPDGLTLSFTRTRPSVGGTAPFMDVWVLDLASGVETNLTNGRGPCYGASWSPDGSTLAFAGHTEPNDIWWGKNYGIWTIPAEGGEPTEITAGEGFITARAIMSDPGRGIAWPSAKWSGDGSTLYFIVTIEGTCNIYAADAAGGNVRPITSGRQIVTDLAVAGDVVLYGVMTSTTPADLWALARGEATRLTNLNADLLEEFTISPAEKISFASFDGQEIEAWLIPPSDFDPDGTTKYPLILSIHGGPHGAYGDAFHHSFQTFSSAGSFVLYVNPRGSQGYGEFFAKQCIGDWGGGDFKDLMAAIDFVLARGRVDETKLGAWGASYGGYMTTWSAGQTDRFAAIVSVVPVTDLLSFYGTSDIGHYFAPFEMGAQPWEDSARYVRMSPLTYAENVVTPLLLVHHEQDMRCPISQSEQYFTRLKSLGKTIEFVRINDASHGILPPARVHAALLGLEAAHEWFGEYLGL